MAFHTSFSQFLATCVLYRSECIIVVLRFALSDTYLRGSAIGRLRVQCVSVCICVLMYVCVLVCVSVSVRVCVY